MKSKFRINKSYFILAVLLFAIEVLIAVYVHDRIIRPYIGDFLVVILLYCTVRSLLDVSVLSACILVLIFSFLIEFLQYLQLVNWLGLQHSAIARTVLGSYFEWMDLVAYTAGIASVLIIERIIVRNKSKQN